MSEKITLNYGSETISAILTGGTFHGEIRPNPVPRIMNLSREVLRCLGRPVNSVPLTVLARSARNIAVAVSDHTRVVPSGLILESLCQELSRAGVPLQSITVVVGVGNHRPVTEAEKKRLLGPMYGQLRCYHSKETGYKMIGVTKRGTPIEVAEPIAEADLVIGLGSIEFHQLTGFSGGVKCIAAGTASPKALEHNHRLSSLEQNALGVLEGNIVRRDMEEFAFSAGLAFIVNVVLNELNEPVFVTAGDPIQAHLIGCEAAARLMAVAVDRQADLVIVSPGGAPRDDTVYQAQKSVRNALRVVKDGGTMIVAAKCGEGFGDPVFEQWMNEALNPAELEARICKEFVLGGHKGKFIAQAVEKAHISWVSELEPAQVRRLFFEPYKSLQEAVNSAMTSIGDSAVISVMPWGGMTVPVIRQLVGSR